MADDQIKILYEPPQEKVTVIEEAPDPAKWSGRDIEGYMKAVQRVEQAQLIDALKGAGAYDPSNTFEDENGWLSLYDVNRSDENTEQTRKFKDKYPKGDLVYVPTDNGNIAVARKSAEEPFRKLGNVGPIAATLTSPETLLSVAAGIGTGGSSLPISMGLQFAAGAAGSAIDDAIESSRGYQDSSYGSMAGDALLSGTMGAAAEPFARGLTGAIGVGKEAHLSSYKPVVEAATSGDVEVPILRGQLGSPIKNTLFKFVSRFSPRAKTALREQRATFRSELERNANIDPAALAAMSDEQLDNYLNNAGADIILSKLGGSVTTQNEVGKILTTALQQYKNAGKAATDSLYSKAEGFGQYEMWNANPLKKFAKEKLTPVVGRADAQGQPVADYGDVELSAPLNRELKNIYEDINSLDPVIALHKGNSGLKQLMTLRTRVADLMLSDVPGSESKQVAQLYDELTKTIENPVTGNGAFVSAWREANDSYRNYMDFLRFGQVKAALNNKPAEKVAEKFMQPGNLDFLKLVRSNLVADPATEPAWKALQRGFIDQFTKNTDALASANSRIQKFSQEELDTLLTREEQKTLRIASFQAQQIKNGPASTMLKEFNTEGARILDLVKDANAAELERIVKFAGGMDSDTAAALRGGVFQNLLHASEYVDDATGQMLVDPAKLSTTLSELRKSRRLSPLFREEDWRRFGNWEKVAAVVGRSSDEGSSIQAGEVASELAETPFSMLANPLKPAKVFLKLAFSDTLGYVLSRPASYEKVLAATTNMEQKRRDRAAINATWQVLADLTKTYSEREDLTPEQETKRAVDKLKETPGAWDYIKSMFTGGSSEPPAVPAPMEAPSAPPPIGKQGALQPPAAQGSMPRTNMAAAMPPPPPQPPSPKGIAGSRYAALFPGDTLGAMAASGGIASLQG